MRERIMGGGLGNVAASCEGPVVGGKCFGSVEGGSLVWVEWD